MPRVYRQFRGIPAHFGNPDVYCQRVTFECFVEIAGIRGKFNVVLDKWKCYGKKGSFVAPPCREIRASFTDYATSLDSVKCHWKEL
jgi:hypothetical protein